MRFTFLLFFLLSLSVKAQEINWILVDYPPYYILQDEHKGQGRDELIIKEVIKHLPTHYTMKYHIMPASRAVKAITKPRDVYCVISLFKNTQRQKRIAFTNEHSTIGLSPVIALKKELANKLALSPTKPVSLEALLQQNKLTLGVTLNRSYGESLDHLIKTAPKHQIAMRAGIDSLKSLTYMLHKRRVDLLLGYASEHHYMAQLNNDNSLTHLALTEPKQITKGYLGCSKNAKGQQVVEQLNEALKKVNTSKAFNSIMLKWLPKNIKPHLESYLAEHNQ